MNWIQTAKVIFGDIDICGNGRFAVCSILNGKVRSVYLLDDEERAHAALLGFDGGKVVDLKPKPPCPTAPRCKNRDYEDNPAYR